MASGVAVDGLSLALEAGQIALMLGPNGAGKSTTLSAMAGAIVPSAGDDHDRRRGRRPARPGRWRKKVGFADQPPALYEFFTVAEHVGFIAQARPAPRPPPEPPCSSNSAFPRSWSGPAASCRSACASGSGSPRPLVGPVQLVLLDETLNGLDPHARALRPRHPARPPPTAARRSSCRPTCSASRSGCAIASW